MSIRRVKRYDGWNWACALTMRQPTAPDSNRSTTCAPTQDKKANFLSVVNWPTGEVMWFWFCFWMERKLNITVWPCDLLAGQKCPSFLGGIVVSSRSRKFQLRNCAAKRVGIIYRYRR